MNTNEEILEELLDDLSKGRMIDDMEVVGLLKQESLTKPVEV